MTNIDVEQVARKGRYLVHVSSDSGLAGAVVLDLRLRIRCGWAAGVPRRLTVAGIHRAALERWCDSWARVATITWTCEG